MKKLLASLVVVFTALFSIPALACSVAPQPVGHVASNNIYRVVGSGSDLIFTYGNPNGFNSSRTISFGAGSGLNFIGTWNSTTGLLTSFGAAGQSYPNERPGGIINLNGVLGAIEIHNGTILGVGGTWSDGVSDISGLGLGQSYFTVSGTNSGVPLTRSYKASGYCSSFSQQDLDAVGMAIIHEEKPAQRLWWDR